jgi:hypothetical protein
MPLQSEDLATFFFVGRVANAAAFGKGSMLERSPGGRELDLRKLMARFRECTTGASRSGYQSY